MGNALSPTEILFEEKRGGGKRKKRQKEEKEQAKKKRSSNLVDKNLSRRTIINSSDLLLDQWSQQVKEMFPKLHSNQQETLAFIVQAIIQSGDAVMQRVAEAAGEYLSSETKIVSHERRLQRFVANDRIEVEGCWKQFQEKVLPFWQNKPVTLILDMTP